MGTDEGSGNPPEWVDEPLDLLDQVVASGSALEKICALYLLSIAGEYGDVEKGREALRRIEGEMDGPEVLEKFSDVWTSIRLWVRDHPDDVARILCAPSGEARALALGLLHEVGVSYDIMKIRQELDRLAE